MPLGAETEILENESEVVEKAKTDDHAFEILYRFYLPRIYGYLFKRTGQRQVAEDLTSETFLKVFGNLKKYQSKNYPFSAWLYRIATNNLIDYYRRAGWRKEVALETVFDEADKGESAAEGLSRQEESQVVKSAIRLLPRRYQEVINLKFYADLSHKELAATLGISANNTRVLLHRSLLSFKEHYENIQKH